MVEVLFCKQGVAVQFCPGAPNVYECKLSVNIKVQRAALVQLVERYPSKLEVNGSRPLRRSVYFYSKIMNDILNKNLLIIHESFPRIGNALEVFWSEPEFSPYINKLVSVDRPDRQGFPFEIVVALTELQILHDELFPHLRVEDPENWSSSKFGTL